jgi:transcriptional regulator with XRE-family HTH domain
LFDRTDSLPVTPAYSSRLETNHDIQIDTVRDLRSAANQLRSSVAVGSYQNEELKRFWGIVQSAGSSLRISNPDLAERAGLGNKYFSTVVRDARRPKLENLLRALTAIIDVADERISDFEKLHAGSHLGNRATSKLRIDQDHEELLLLAISLAEIAKREIERRRDARPNDPAAMKRNNSELELLEIFAKGFQKIATALASLSASSYEPLLLAKAQELVTSVGNQLNTWWHRNGEDAIDWGVRVPVFGAGVALLGWAGANMTIATSAIAAIVGGSKVVEVLRRSKSK